MYTILCKPMILLEFKILKKYLAITKGGSFATPPPRFNSSYFLNFDY